MIDFDKVIDINHLRPWSFSKVQKAKKCQYEFFFRYVEKLKPLERADFLILGNGIHFVLENALNAAFKRRKPINRDLLYYFARLFKQEEPEVDIKAMESFFPNIVKFVNGQLRRIDGNSFIASEMELAVDSSFSSVNFRSKDVFLRGKLDFLFSKGDTLYIIDHKTNKSFDFSNKIKTQLRWYALLASVNFPQFDKFALEVHNVRYGTVNRIIFTSKDVNNFKLKLIPLIEILESDLIGKSFKELQPTPTELNCKWCEYKSICPAFR